MKRLAPRDARTFKAVCSLESDNHSTRDGWIITTGDGVVLVNQKSGEIATGDVRFTYGQFNRLVDWYNKAQRTSPSS